MTLLDRKSRIYISGHKGMVGQNLCRFLTAQGFTNLITASRDELDLLNTAKVNSYFEKNKPDYVVHAAAKVGGIHTNRAFPADFLYENVTTTLNVFKSAERTDVKKVLFMGSGCVYAPETAQPMHEGALFHGGLEPSCDGMALSKLVGIKMTELYQRQMGRSFISVIPANLYGPGDNFHPEHSHVIPGLMLRLQKMIREKSPEMVVWGTGNAVRDFLYIDDLVDALFMLLENYNQPEPINISAGAGFTIRELAETMADVMGFGGKIVFDTTKPDGMPRKVLDGTRIREQGWKARFDLRKGLSGLYHWALNNDVFERYL
jgi:GDP-L-fucose synthase